MTEAVAEAVVTEDAAPAAAPESLIHSAAPAAAPAAAEPAAEASADAFAFADKVLVKREDGAPDWEQTARKAEQARQHLEKRLGAGEVPPKDVSGYEFTVPEDLQGFEIQAEKVDAFKSEALQRGITPAQFKWMMDSYLKAAPDLMGGVVKMQASQAREALGQVWANPDELSRNLQASQRAVQAMPADLQEATLELGTNPAFIRAMSWIGAQLGEDRAPGLTHAAPSVDLSTLQMSEAYRNPRHPEHAKVSEQVRRAFAAKFGNEPV